ncbi:MAG: aminoacyl-histidine dipeptidase [Spirochaetaceae bacterium]|nr:aminoacyl-histidine dipeptidase [Spirochaetaceae bacterium]
MLETLSHLDSFPVFQYFYQINQIPRGSGNEKAISDWLVNFAKERKLKVVQDAANNVIIYKAGSKGYENAKPIILQGHIDMVCEKDKTSTHNFLTDPIAFIVEGDILKADKTTLGADNGVAIAMALAILDSELPHPPLEVLCTVSEETGMDGAIAIDPALFTGRTLINIDSEEEGVFLTSCAGGKECFYRLPIEWVSAPENMLAYEISVKGLLGGHSGMEISKERANALKLLGRTLQTLQKNITVYVTSIDGGSKHNAIPREANARILVAEKDKAILQEVVEVSRAIFKNEFSGVDDSIQLDYTPSDKPSTSVFSQKTIDSLLDIIRLTRHGVIRMSHSIDGLVETSNNLAILKTDVNEIHITCAIRSSVKSQKEDVAEEFEIIAKRCQAKFEADAGYPEWQYKAVSPIRDIFISVYKSKFGKEPKISAIHAGLECGILSEKFNGEIDQISFGPNIYDVHTPNEHLSILSLDRTWSFLKAVLENIRY